ncbi:MBL fold metallo-hydrolase [Candidatus Woesearchaeota archaeon]|nr:MBL fold metallo-hydrolase [Candidatus Woesearchaeota archaeon]
MAQLIFLGTSGDSSVTARQLRSSGGIILQTEELQFHIDPGPGALVRAKEFGINPRATDAVLVSHHHLNHSNDLNAVIDAMTLGGLDKKGILISNQTTINGSDAIIPALSAFHRSCLERIIILKPDQKAAVEEVEVHAIPVVHSDKEAIGFKLLTPTFTLGYTGDTAFTKDLAAALQRCDILILNTTYPGDTKTDNHLNREGATKIVERVKPKLAIITHFGFDMLKADPLLEARNIQIATGVQTVAAQDGLVINPSSYAANSGQARLSSFTESE